MIAILISVVLTVAFMWLYGSYMVGKGYLTSWKGFWDDKLMGLFLLILGFSGAQGFVGLLKVTLQGIGWLMEL